MFTLVSGTTAFGRCVQQSRNVAKTAAILVAEGAPLAKARRRGSLAQFVGGLARTAPRLLGERVDGRTAQKKGRSFHCDPLLC